MNAGENPIRFLKTSKPKLIAIVGGSGSGKSWLADKLQKRFEKITTRLSLDDFYRDRSHLSEKQRAKINFDHPRAIDWESLERVLSSFAAGRSTEAPQYDFTTHSRLQKGKIVKPTLFVIIDGLWLLRRQELRRMFSCRVFIECPRRVCLSRRIARDLAERGRDAASVRQQYREQVAPMHERFVATQLRWANVVLKDANADTAAELGDKLEELLAQN
ncbi:MAG: uridine kinase [Verrucomicrobiota bacterium]